jgi:AcrR family transcriptional regulator
MPGEKRKSTRVQANLSAERVRAEALRLIEEDGLGSFSIRRLGRALGVEAMAVYWYYPSKDALLDAVAGALVDRMEPLDPTKVTEGDYIGALRQIAHNYRKLALGYPRAFELLATHRPVTPGVYRVLDELCRHAQAYGVDPRTTARHYRLFAGFCSGACLHELATRAAPRRSDGQASGAVLTRVAKVLAWLNAEHAEDLFSFGLERVLASLEANAPSSWPKPRRRVPGKRTR